MKKILSKITLLTISLLFILFIFNNISNAGETYVATSTINNVTINWSYELNKSGEIEALKCTNIAEVTGDVTIPSTLDGKTVVNIGNSAFRGATGLTGVTIPISVKSLSDHAFRDCTNLKSVDLGNVKGMGRDTFYNCTSLESITIPKSVTEGTMSPVFGGCTSLTEIILEDGLTIIPSYLCAGTNITSIEIPTSVKSISDNAFSDCSSLKNIDLKNIEGLGRNTFKNCTSLKSITIPKSVTEGTMAPVFGGCTNLTEIILEEGITVVPSYLCAGTNITSIKIPTTVKAIESNAFRDCTNLENIDLENIDGMSYNAFANCTLLKSITIPKSVTNGTISPVFAGCTNLTEIILEEGITVVPSYICAGTKITSIKVPNTVKAIDSNAFSDCTNLENVDLGNIDGMSYNAFRNCTSLKSITIPKSVTNGTILPVFAGCTNLTEIVLEEGITVVPSYLCAGTNITSIEIPNTVKVIDTNAFKDCKELKKITILDNVTSIGYSVIAQNTDSVFGNHNDDLTIYCYEGSEAADYAIRTNIKYVYLTRPSTDDETNKEDDKVDPPVDEKDPVEDTNKPSEENKKPSDDKEDNTIAGGEIPQTGLGLGLTAIIITLLSGCILIYFKYSKLKDI